MGKVYDFKTRSLCKCCIICKYWRDARDFPADMLGKYGVADVCINCRDEVEPVSVLFVPEEDWDDEVA